MAMVRHFRCLVLASCVLGTGGGATQAAQVQGSPLIAFPNDAAAPAGAAVALLALARERGQVRVIVGLRDPLSEPGPPDRSRPEAEAPGSSPRAAQWSLLAELGAYKQLSGAYVEQGMQGVTLFDSMAAVAMSVEPAMLQRLLASPRVASVLEDVAVPPTLVESVPLVTADQTAAAGFSGTGQVVAVLDTGIAREHPMFAGKVVSEACYSTTVPGQSLSLCPDGAQSSTTAGSGTNCSLAITGCDHGTHVASIAVGSAASLKGVARRAKLIAIQVFSRFDSVSSCNPLPAPCALSYFSDQIRGLERVHALRRSFKIASANMSLGGGAYATDCDSGFSAHKAIIDRLRAARIATVIAAGNAGFDGFISAPACISTAVAVGSTTKTDKVSSFSNHAPTIDLLAPGSGIRAAVPGGFATFDGTSMAAPHVAGAFAIMKQGKPGASVSGILAALSCTGRPVARAGIVRPRIDVRNALAVLRSPATGCR